MQNKNFESFKKEQCGELFHEEDINQSFVNSQKTETDSNDSSLSHKSNMSIIDEMNKESDKISLNITKEKMEKKLKNDQKKISVNSNIDKNDNLFNLVRNEPYYKKNIFGNNVSISNDKKIQNCLFENGYGNKTLHKNNFPLFEKNQLNQQGLFEEHRSVRQKSYIHTSNQENKSKLLFGVEEKSNECSKDFDEKEIIFGSQQKNMFLNKQNQKKNINFNSSRNQKSEINAVRTNYTNIESKSKSQCSLKSQDISSEFCVLNKEGSEIKNKISNHPNKIKKSKKDIQKQSPKSKSEISSEKVGFLGKFVKIINEILNIIENFFFFLGVYGSILYLGFIIFLIFSPLSNKK